MPAIPYSATLVDLIYPCQRGGFFPEGLPGSDAALCAEMSRLAYCHTPPDFAFPRATIAETLAGIGFSSVEFFETAGQPHSRGIHAFLATNDERSVAVLAFRGTDATDPLDLFSDLDFKLVAWSRGGRVHEGFARALGSVRPAIDAALAGVSCRLLITGHSLGAALATVLTSDLIAARPQVELYTFGSPRCGDAGFAATVPVVVSHRYVDCCDKITRIPFDVMAYEHIGDPLYIDRHGAITADTDAHAIAADRVAGVEEYARLYFGHPGTVPVRELADHTCINYVSAVMGLRA